MVIASSGTVAASEPVPTCLGEVATIVGTSATETIRGTAGPDVIVGRGSDTGDCVRQAPVAGVPTIYRHYEPAFVEEVALFTADTEVTVEFASGSNTDLEHKLQILREARLVGQSQPATALPAPRADILAYVQQNCGATP
jgi:hypothetical protein